MKKFNEIIKFLPILLHYCVSYNAKHTHHLHYYLPFVVDTGKKKKKIMLDDFLWALLHDETYISCIQWTMKERLEFKFTRPEMVAKLWGDFKKKKRMNYEKLSRGLRYYYHSKKLERIQHKHYHFRFLTTKESDNIEINLTGDKSLDG